MNATNDSDLSACARDILTELQCCYTEKNDLLHVGVTKMPTALDYWRNGEEMIGWKIPKLEKWDRVTVGLRWRHIKQEPMMIRLLANVEKPKRFNTPLNSKCGGHSQIYYFAQCAPFFHPRYSDCHKLLTFVAPKTYNEDDLNAFQVLKFESSMTQDLRKI